jgi:hypothetical protein
MHTGTFRMIYQANKFKGIMYIIVKISQTVSPYSQNDLSKITNQLSQIHKAPLNKVTTTIRLKF